jgi:cystine transport system permease protein
MTDERWLRMMEIVLNSLWPVLRGALLYTIPITVLSFAIGLILALLVALSILSSKPYLHYPARFYVWLIRGTPLLVLLFILFYGLPSVGIYLPAYLTAIIAFSMNGAAYKGEIIRSALTSIPQGQWRAGYSIGMNYLQVLKRIILPQATRVSLPPLGNSFIDLFKATSLVALITIADLFGVAKQIAASTFEPMLLYLVAAVFYLFFCSFLSAIQNRFEKKFGNYTV